MYSTVTFQMCEKMRNASNTDTDYMMNMGTHTLRFFII